VVGNQRNSVGTPRANYTDRATVLDSRHYQIFLEVVGLEWGPFSLVSIIWELLGRKNSGSGLESREYGRRYPSRSRGTLYPQKVALTSPTSGGRSVGIVRSRAQAKEFFCLNRQTYSEHLDRSSLLSFFQEKKSRIKEE
jgi:hypothetical protein